MTIRTRLSLLFTAIVSGLLLLFCLVIYVVAEYHRQNEFRERLRAEALTSAELLFGKETISPQLYKLLDKNHMTVLNQEEIIIYDYRNQIIYESGTDYLSVDKARLNQVRTEQEVYWREGNREIVGARFNDRSHRLVVLASAVDKYGFSKQQNLAHLLIASWLIGTLLVGGTGWLFAGRSLRPLQQIISRVDEVTASQLGLRLAEGPQDDELTQLARRFNRMLDRLEDAFRTQRAFVSHASHELRTPLTAITGQMEVALLANDNPAEMRTMIQSVLDDIRGLNRLTNGLLSLANLSVDESAVRLSSVQLDELLWQVRADLLRLQPTYHVIVNLDNLPASENELHVKASEPLLRTALFNLMENGAKFAPDHRVSIRLTGEATTLALIFHNGGPPIAAEELPEIFKPFHRGTNGRFVAGHGIGLSLTQRIVQLHRGRLTVVSDTESGTTFRLDLPRLR